MIFDVRRPSIAETLERMEWMAKEVFIRVQPHANDDSRIVGV